MSFTNISLILLDVLLNTAAQLCLKQGMQSVGSVVFSLSGLLSALTGIAADLFILGGLACYAVSFCVWLAVLSRVEVSVAYPMLSIGYVVTAAAGWYFWGEALTAGKLLGIGIICLGVAILFKS